MNFLSAFFTGVVVSANPVQAPADAPPASEVAAPQVDASGHVDALAAADVDFYLDIMREAAGKAASGVCSSATVSADCDEMVAGERGVKERYDTVKAEIGARLAMRIEPGAGGAAAAREPDGDVLAPHLAEIETLQNLMRGFMNER